MPSRPLLAVPLLVVLTLSACSSSKPAAPAVDYGKSETVAATAYVKQAAPLQGSSASTSLQFVKAYCDGVSKEGVKAENRDMLLITTAATVDGVAAGRGPVLPGDDAGRGLIRTPFPAGGRDRGSC